MLKHKGECQNILSGIWHLSNFESGLVQLHVRTASNHDNVNFEPLFARKRSVLFISSLLRKDTQHYFNGTKYNLDSDSHRPPRRCH